ncbi:hypothetical protein ACQEU5_25140 [Marinactinospora thermotolerans]|uniref:hypothetical protein n=1 Tax=Marinactinospora thermotolerans TaxID=531310 RepID=UPI003D90D458
MGPRLPRPQVAAAIADAKQEWKAAGGVERARREMAARLDRARRLRAEAEQEGRPCHIRFGSLPQSGRSWNHRDNQAEAGVSVYAAWQLDGGRYVVDLRDVDAISAAFIIDEDAPVYEVTGTLLDETGADGEPLIANAAARQVRPTSIETVV